MENVVFNNNDFQLINATNAAHAELSASGYTLGDASDVNAGEFG